MKKIFTFVFCALCAVSVWGSEVTIGGNGSNDTNVPINLGSTYSASQSIYTAEELTNAGIPANANISKISFKYAASNSELTRNIKIYITNRESDVALSYTTTKYKFDIVTSTDLFYDGTITTPTSATFYDDISLSKNFVWDGISNICIIVCDNTGSIGAAYKSHKASNVSANPGRCIYSTGYQINPTSSMNTGEKNDYRPVIKITYSTGTGPVTTPTITSSTNALDFGTCYPEYEDAIQTFTVKASDLTNKITITAPAGVVVSPTEIAKEEAALAGDGVTVTAQITKDFTFPAQAPSITIASENASSKTVKVNATEGTFAEPIATTYFKPDNENVVNHNGYVFYSEKLTISEVANSQFKPYNTAGFKVDYSSIDIACENSGKVTNLKGKFISKTVFKAFSFDYTAPEQTGIVIDEDEDKSSTWPEDAQSGKSLIIKRAIVPNQWNSIVLPTYLTSTEVESIFGSGTDLEEFTNAVVTSSNITLNFTKKTSGIEAGVPYLIKPTQAIANPLNLTNHSFTKTVTPVNHDGIRFEGVLVPTLIDGGDGSDYIIVGANNTLLHPTGTGTIKGMRAYFHVVGPAAIAALKTAKVSMNTGSTTELVLVKDNQVKPYKTMVNDQIVIVNEGKQINILGQTVK